MAISIPPWAGPSRVHLVLVFTQQPCPSPGKTCLFSVPHQGLWPVWWPLFPCCPTQASGQADLKQPLVQPSAQLQTSSLLEKTTAAFWRGPQQTPIIFLSQGIPAAQWAYHSAPVKWGRRAWAPRGGQALPLLQTAVIYRVGTRMRMCVCICMRAKPPALSRFACVISFDLEVEQILLAPLYRWGNWILVNVIGFLYQTLC